MDLRGAVVVVTGASSGIGEATAIRFAAAGARVVLAARRADRLEALADRIRARGGEALPLRTDVTVAVDREALARAAHERFGRCDVLVNNAGIPGGGPFKDLSAEQIDRIVGVNLLGVLHTTRAFLPTFLEQRRGHVVNVASLAGRVAPPGASVYGATKHAVVGFGEALFHELRPFGILVTSVNPGFTRTESFGNSGVPPVIVLRPERVARTIVDVVRRGRAPEVSIPRPAAALQAFRILTPPLYRWGMGLASRRSRPPVPRPGRAP